MTAQTASAIPVRKSITVNASVEHAFHVYTAGFDSWWPREHHIGKSPMKRAIIEGAAGGRCYSEQVDGTECDWGRILVWDPPHRFVMAWQISPSWQYEPDLAKASEVDVRFTALVTDRPASISSIAISNATARAAIRSARRSMVLAAGAVCSTSSRRERNPRPRAECEGVRTSLRSPSPIWWTPTERLVSPPVGSYSSTPMPTRALLMLLCVAQVGTRPPTERFSYTILMNHAVAGTEVDTYGDLGVLDSTFEFNDRGRGPKSLPTMPWRRPVYPSRPT